VVLGLPHPEKLKRSSIGVLIHNPLDLIERDYVGRSIVELRRPRALMRGHCLSVLERFASFKIGGDPCSTKGVPADFGLQAWSDHNPLEPLKPAAGPKHPMELLICL
jgi:hypothetical protein